MKEIRVREFYGKRGAYKIFIKEYLPEAAEKSENAFAKYPAVILSHGFGGNYEGMEYYAIALTRKGYAAYCFDFCGGCIVGRSDGSSTEMTVETECMDLKAVLHEVQSLPYIDNEHISLLGCSQGGFISGLVAGECGEEIDNLIMFFPALCIPDHARMGCLGGASYDVNNVPEIIECPGGMRISKAFHDNVVSMDPFLRISAYKGRVLLLQGLDDNIVNYSYAVKAKESYAADNCMLQLIKNAGHCFDEQQNESAIIAVEHFLDKKQELLSIQVFITGCTVLADREDYYEAEVSFTGYCENRYFKGCIIPEGVDVQKRHGDGPVVLRAEYTLQGVDFENKSCKIHIINSKAGERYRPVIDTDSSALGFLNNAELTAALECWPGGLTVRIFG